VNPKTLLNGGFWKKPSIVSRKAQKVSTYMGKFDLFSKDEQTTIPLNRTSESIAIVAKATEANFQNLLRTIESDHPQIKIIYKRISPGKLWITTTDPKNPVSEAER
jgi:hypothetical protein